LIQKYSISEDTAQHLAIAYGGRAWDVCELAEPTGVQWPRYGKHIAEGYPYIEAEVKYACREYVRHVSDFLAFRSRLAFLNTHAAGQALDAVADIMAVELHWSVQRKKKEILDAREMILEFGGPVPDKAGATLREATLTDLASVFSAIDADGSGFIDATELQQASRALGFQLQGNELKKAFNAMDPTGDGKVHAPSAVGWTPPRVCSPCPDPPRVSVCVWSVG